MMNSRSRLMNFLLICTGILPLACLAADWPQFLGPTRNGVSPETGLQLTFPKQGPPVVWQMKVGAGFSGPVVAGENLILFHRLGDREVVECLETSTGKKRWQLDYPTLYRDDFGFDEGPRSTPLVDGGRVYTVGAEGKMACVELDSGKQVWQRPLNEEYRVKKGFFGVGTSPLAEGQLLLFNVGGPGAGIVALNKDTGREVWKATGDEASYASPVAATIDGVRHALFFTREGIVSLDPANGSIRFNKRWRPRISASVNAATPLVVGNHVFVSTSYSTGAILLDVGKAGVREVWKGDDFISNHYNTCVHHAGYLYGIDGRQEYGARLRCVELKTGKVSWTRDGFGCATLILVEGNLLGLTENGELVLVEATPAGYREKARAQVLTKPCRAHIALAEGRLYGRDSQRLLCWSLKK